MMSAEGSNSETHWILTISLVILHESHFKKKNVNCLSKLNISKQYDLHYTNLISVVCDKSSQRV